MAVRGRRAGAKRYNATWGKRLADVKFSVARADPALASRSVHACPGLSLANKATERAALQRQVTGPIHGEIARVGLAPLGFVALPPPFAGPARLHPHYIFHTERRPAALALVGFFFVVFRFAGIRIFRLLQPDDRAARGPAAIG